MTESIDLVISFDTTGSMYPCLTQLKRNLNSFIKDLFDRVPGLKVGIIAHGDYCDSRDYYVIKELDLTDNINKIIHFINNSGQTGGGDAPECYELALRKARQMSWRSGKSKVFMLIGDDVPHGPTYPLNVDKIDWRNELELLLEANINVYGVHAMPGCRTHSKSFYQEIAKKTGGFYLTLDQFSTVGDMIMAVATNQAGAEQFDLFVDQMKSSGKMNRNISQIISTISGRAYSCTVSVTDASGEELKPVPTGRFQVLSVDNDCVIKSFVEGQGVSFKAGRGFYQLSKSEKVSAKKELVLMEKSSGDLFYGPKVREILGLDAYSDGKLSSKNLLDKYNIFIQSTSYNRKLVGKTLFLYEVSDWEK